jgi:hypothetical protein
MASRIVCDELHTKVDVHGVVLRIQKVEGGLACEKELSLTRSSARRTKTRWSQVRPTSLSTLDAPKEITRGQSSSGIFHRFPAKPGAVVWPLHKSPALSFEMRSDLTRYVASSRDTYAK